MMYQLLHAPIPDASKRLLGWMGILMHYFMECWVTINTLFVLVLARL